MPPTLAVEQYQYSDTGIVLNSDAVLPFVDIEEVSGLDSAPLRTTTKDREGNDGAFVDAIFETVRTIVLKGTIYTNPTAFESYLETLKANFQPTPVAVPFYFQTDAGPRVVYGKSQGLRYVKTNERSYGKQQFNITILCEDPRVYDSTTQTTTITLGSAVGGRGYLKSYPFGYGAVVKPNSGTITLNSTRDTPGFYVLHGPITNPIIINDTLGLAWTFTGISLSSDDYLEINPALKTVRLNGGTSRRTSMKGRWWMLRAGNNDFRLTGSGGTDGVTNLVISGLPARR